MFDDGKDAEACAVVSIQPVPAAGARVPVAVRRRNRPPDGA